MHLCELIKQSSTILLISEVVGVVSNFRQAPCVRRWKHRFISPPSSRYAFILKIPRHRFRPLSGFVLHCAFVFSEINWLFFYPWNNISTDEFSKKNVNPVVRASGCSAPCPPSQFQLLLASKPRRRARPLSSLLSRMASLFSFLSQQVRRRGCSPVSRPQR